MLDTVASSSAQHGATPHASAAAGRSADCGAARLITDQAYLLRGNPEHPEHDILGLRNPEAFQHPELVFLGGGQVYGTGLTADQCWPSLLRQRLGGGVLNAGMPGWGSVQYALAAEELSALSPRHMTLCLSPANDLVQAFNCASLSASVLARSFFEPQWLELTRPEPASLNLAGAAITRVAAEHPGLCEEDVLAILAERGEPDVNPCVLESSRYYLAERSLLAMLDLDNPAIEAGLAITRKVLEHLRTLSQRRRFGLSVLLLPTRELLVCRQLHKAQVRDRDSLERLGLAETTVLGLLRATCAKLGLRCFDLTNFLAPYAGARIHAQNSRQGQLSARGCQLVARFVRDRVLPGSTLRKPRRSALGGVSPL